MPPVPPADASSNQHHPPNRRRAKQCRRCAPQSAARLPSLARYGVRAVESSNEQQGFMAKPCTPQLIAQRVQLFKRQSRNVSLSLGDKKGVFSFAKENTPFDKAAPIQTSILTPCVSMVMMHPAMVTPSRMTGTARFRRISSTAAMSAPVHAPVPGSGMATKSSSPHVW